jgi:hypothetical protein
MSQQDYFEVFSSLENDLNPKPTTEETLDLNKRFEKERIEWSTKISNLNKLLKDMSSVQALLLEIYTERQRAVEFYYYLVSLLIDINKKYRKEYMKKYQFYTYQSQERFSNESLKTQKILTDLEDIVFKKDLLETHSKFIQESIKTIDNIIWATKTRVELEQISRGK